MVKSFFSFLVFLSVLTFNHSAFAQILEPVKWETYAEKTGEGEFNLVFKAKAEDGWSVYSQFTGEGGPYPTELYFEEMGGATLAGKATEQGHRKEGPDPLFEGVNVIKFLSDEPFIITQKVTAKDISTPLSGFLTFMTCDNEKCLPPTDIEFSFDLGEARAAAGSPSSSFSINSVAADNNDNSKIFEPVTWDISKKKINADTYELIYRASIEKGWTVYSQYLESDDGPVATEIYYENQEGIELLGKSTETGKKKEGKDPLFDNMNVVKFLADEDFVITQKIKVRDASKPTTGFLTYMTCDKERCLPPTDIEFSFSFGEESAAAPGTALNSDLKVVDQRRQPIIKSVNAPLTDCGKEAGEKKDTSLWLLFIGGMLGGFAALLTPCVFPMIPITVSFFTKDTKRKGWVNGLLYGLSIIVIYVALGFLITKLFGAEALNSLATNWIANTIFFLIFMVFAFSFFGFYEITLPSSWTTKTDQMADKGGFLGIFFMAATLALVSFSCTGPIVGTALVTAAKGGAIGPLVVMFGFSAALALPFGLFAAFPAWLNTLPRSGGWMNSVKVVLGFLEVAFAFKFLSTADLTEHWGFLKYELFLLIFILVAFAIALYLFGFIKFPHDSPIKKLSTTRKVLGTAFAALGLYFITGFTINKDTGIYNSLSMISGITPPVNYNFFLSDAEVDQSIGAQYSSYTLCANNIPCFKDYFQGLEYAKSVDKPLFLDFTGHGCQNCRKTEDQVWVDPNVRNMLTNDVVLVSLYVDDRKQIDEQFISAYDNKKKRNVGNRWTDFQVVNFQQNSQPLYVMMNTDEKVVTHPRGYNPSIDEYVEYMECGLEFMRAN